MVLQFARTHNEAYMASLGAVTFEQVVAVIKRYGTGFHRYACFCLCQCSCKFMCSNTQSVLSALCHRILFALTE